MRFGLGIGIPRQAGGKLPTPPITISQAAVVSIAARLFDPIVVDQSLDTSVVAQLANTTPITICGSNLLQWCRADLGVTIGTDFLWSDQSGGATNYTKLVAATGPSLTSSDSTLSNLATLTFDGTSQSCTSALQLPAPGTTPTLIWLIMKQITWTLNENLISGDGGPVIRQSATTPKIRQINTSLGTENAAATLTTWKRVAAWFNNGTSDFLKVGSTNATGINAGNASDATAARHLGRNAGATTFSNFAIAEIVYSKANDLTALDAYGLGRYGAGLF